MAHASDALGPYSSLLHQLYRASHEMPSEQFQEAALGLLKPLFLFERSMWGGGRPLEGGGVMVHTMHLHELPGRFLTDWQEVNHEDTIVEEVTAHLGRAIRAHVPTLYADRAKRGIRSHADRYGVGNALVICSAQPEQQLMHWISLFRREADQQFSIEDKGRFEMVWPHVMQALTINRAVNLDRVYMVGPKRRACLAIADRHGVVYHREPLFESVLQLEWATWRPPRLPAEVVAAMADPWHRYEGERIHVEFRHAADMFFLKARERSKLDDLTPRAREIARHFARGLSHKEIARLLRVSPATVRNHLQDVYRKLDVSDKAELALLLAEGG